MSKKSRKRNKKILAALALAGGAAMLAKGRGKGAVSTVGQAVGADRITPKSNWITKKDVLPNVVSDAAPIVRRPPIGKMHGAGTAADAIANQDIRAGVSNRVTGILPPSRLTSPARPDRFGRIHANTPMRAYKGGGIAKRGTGVALKKGGRVTGIAKRGFGRALMKGKK